MNPLHRLTLATALVAAALPTAALAAAEHTVTQKAKAFSQAAITIKAGDKINFRNDDPFVHNVFSLTDGLNFDLGTYPQGQSRAQAFPKAGKFEIECAIHPEMKLIVNVTP